MLILPLEPPVQILPTDARPRVPHYDPVGVGHREDVELEHVPHELGDRVGRNHKGDEAMDGPRCVGLGGVDAGKDDKFLLGLGQAEVCHY